MARRRAAPARSGFLNIDKPPGWTSHDVVARVRRIVGERGVGHAGTLDPAATGVLPVAVGYATRMLPYLEDADKSYIGTVRFGRETDSGDRDGRLVARAEIEGIPEHVIRDVITGFVGDQTQIPPMYSAIRVNGQRLHERARRGETVDVPVRHVEVRAIDLISWNPPDAALHVTCSKGTYIRSLARDMGRKIECGATLANLVRVRAGDFHLRSSISIHDLEQVIREYGWSMTALHPDVALPESDAVILEPEEALHWFNGQAVQGLSHQEHVRVYDSMGDWIGVGVYDFEVGMIRPKRVIRGN